jgi:transposase
VYDRNTIDRVLKLLTEGVSHRDIAARTGVTKNTIGKWASGDFPKYFEQEYDHTGSFAPSTSAGCPA